MVALNEWLASQAPATAQHYRSQLTARESLAALGRLDNDSVDGVVPVSSFPEMYELHWFWRDRDLSSEVHVRQYHGEPGARPDLLVRLHRHIKRVDVDDVRQVQNEAMSFAQLRYVAGRPYHWGAT